MHFACGPGLLLLSRGHSHALQRQGAPVLRWHHKTRQIKLVREKAADGTSHGAWTPTVMILIDEVN
ncbi:MAG: hypothetical protein ACK56F_15285, partial [bacterium]